MTPSELKYHVEQTGSNFFSRASMRFFGDTMANYGVSAKPVMVTTWSDPSPVECWELYRRRAVKCGLATSAYFNTATFARVLPKIN